MTLAELITALEAANPDRVVPHGFTNPHSYRGYYHELAFEPAANVTVAAMLDDARSALYATYQGWKGGDFTMSDTTDCWLSMEGCASGDTISALLLELMLAEPSPAPDEALPVTTSPMSQPEPLTEQQLDEIDTLPAWLYQRFMAGGVGWENLGADDRAYWEHQARAVRRAVARGGFKTASEATSAPLAASQPSEAPEGPGTATRPPTGRTGDPRRTLTPNEYDAAWHAVEGAAGEEGADPGTVLHAVLDRLGIDWQDAARTV